MAMKHVKCVVNGNYGSGVTSLLFTYTTNDYPEEYVPTVFDNYSANVMCEDRAVNLQLWDIYDDRGYKKLLPLNYPQTDVVVYIFSLVDPTSFEDIENYWDPIINEHAPKDCTKILAGTKLDLRDEYISKGLKTISTAQGEQLKKRINAYSYVECSAKKGINVGKIFEEAIKSVFRQEEKLAALLKDEKKSRKFHLFSSSKKQKESDSKNKKKSKDSDSKNKTPSSETSTSKNKSTRPASFNVASSLTSSNAQSSSSELLKVEENSPKIEELENQVKSQSKEILTLKRTKEDLEYRIQSQTKDLTTLRQNKKDLENQIKSQSQSQSQELLTLKQTNESLKNQVESQSKEILTLKRTKEDLEYRVQSQTKDLTTLRQNKKDLENQIKLQSQSQSQELLTLKQTTESLKNQVESQSKEISILKRTKEDLEYRVQSQTKDLTTLRQNKKDLENQIKAQSQSQKNEELENQIKSQSKELLELRQTKEDLENQIKTLKENEKRQNNLIKDLKNKRSGKEISQSSSTNSFDPFESYEKINKADMDANYFIDSDDESNHELIKRVGEGATSITYKIFDKTTEKTMCKKVLKTDSSTTFKNAQDAMKEFEIMHTIRHPCICRAIGINTSETTADGTTTIALFLEFLNYGLKECLDQKIIDNTLKTRIVIDVVHGMKFIHSNGMIHRDLKIENIMLNSVFEAKLVDFGLAKIDMCIHGSSTGQSMTKGIGTLAYMSPEMVNEEPYSNKTDVYSFGVVVYYIYTGGLPNYSMRDKMYGKPVPLPKPSLEISQFCLDLIARCLDANPDERPSFDDILDLIKENNYNLAAGIDINTISKRDRELDFFESKYPNLA